jgi:3-hydroxybutyrate dehydrogenase
MVTGAARGNGYAAAKAFASVGAEVVILDVSERVEEAATALAREAGRAVHGRRCDIANGTEVYSTVDTLGRIDVLVNNAGVGYGTPVAGPRDDVDETFGRVIDINLSGQFFVTRAALPQIGAGGRIIFTASIWGKAAGAEYAVYCASKHGVIGMVRARMSSGRVASRSTRSAPAPSAPSSMKRRSRKRRAISSSPPW